MAKFREIKIEDRSLYKKYLSWCSQKSSDFTFLNVWGWQEVYGLKFLFEENFVWIKQDIPDSSFWAPVGKWDDANWRKYADFLKGKNFTRVPEKLVHIWHKYFDNMEIKEDRDNWDYIYLVEELIELKGNRFHKKKNLLRQFENSYKYEFVTLDDKWIHEAENFQVDWCFYKECDNKEILIKENYVILKVFDNWSKLDEIVGGGLCVDDKLIAFTVAEPVDDSTLVIHFEKGCPTYKGVYQAINNIFLRECARDYTYVNREQDLGDKGLRQAKMSYNPCCFLKKYNVSFF
ncbi:DUF2156 domain-containing protein [Desulfothermus sp.]